MKKKLVILFLIFTNLSFAGEIRDFQNFSYIEQSDTIDKIEEMYIFAITQLSFVCRRQRHYANLIEQLKNLQDNSQRRQLLEQYLKELSELAVKIEHEDAINIRFKYLAQAKLSNDNCCVIL